MKGLIYKDFASAKREILLAVIMCGAFMMFACLAGESALSACLGAIVAVSAMIPTFSLQADKQSGWNRFICASPISRNRVVLSKYIITPALTVAFLGMALLADLACGSPIPFWAFLCFFALDMILETVMIPVCMKLGQNVAALIFVGLVFVPLGLGMLLYKSGILTDALMDRFFALFQAVPPELLAVAFFTVSLILLICSYFLTSRIYRNMEF